MSLGISKIIVAGIAFAGVFSACKTSNHPSKSVFYGISTASGDF